MDIPGYLQHIATKTTVVSIEYKSRIRADT